VTAAPGDDRPTILYFGNDWAAENRTSSHHVARWLARRYRVIYIESPGLRAPKGTGRDLKKLVTKLGLFLRGTRSTPEGLSVQTMMQIPLHRFALVRLCNQALMLATLRLLMLRERISRPVTWFVVPHMASIAGNLGERLSVYYCIDDYAALPDVDVEAIKRMDDDLTRRADLVFVASDTLLEGKRALNPRTHLSPHGVDFDHFVTAQDPALPLPDDIAVVARKGPVIGFFGLIERWIDLDLVAYLAEQRPQWTFVMIGRVAVPDAEVPQRPNILFLGRRPYETLPAYGKAFSAAIIPYRLTRQVLHSNPIKLREYLAMGKPIVSVSAPEIDKFAEVVSVARTREEFLARLDHAVGAGLTAEQRANQTKLASTMTWDARLTKVVEVVDRALSNGVP
jgi:glycosyltransferase involved in cell wall biosynthesis